MVHQIILPAERSAIVNKHLAEFDAATNPVERSILWKKVITNFARLAQLLMKFGNAWIKFVTNISQNTRNIVLRQ